MDQKHLNAFNTQNKHFAIYGNLKTLQEMLTALTGL